SSVCQEESHDNTTATSRHERGQQCGPRVASANASGTRGGWTGGYRNRVDRRFGAAAAYGVPSADELARKRLGGAREQTLSAYLAIVGAGRVGIFDLGDAINLPTAFIAPFAGDR